MNNSAGSKVKDSSMKYTLIMFVVLPAMVLLINTDTSWAARGPVRALAAVRTDTAPVIDGKLDEPCWSQANIAADFTNYKTERLSEEQTLVRVLYDDENLYIAFECLEPDPNLIVAVERKYDQSLWEEDHVSVRLDTFHDHRCAYNFSVNPLGTRYDARIGLFNYRDDSTWGCDWSAACTVEKDHWFVEMAIPIGNILFDRKDAVTWGVNFYRDISRGFWLSRVMDSAPGDEIPLR